MKKKIYYLILVLLTSCSKNKVKISEKNIPNKTASETEIIEETFSEVDSLLKVDNGIFWNHHLYGPILIIDPSSRIFFCKRKQHFEPIQENRFCIYRYFAKRTEHCKHSLELGK